MLWLTGLPPKWVFYMHNHISVGYVTGSPGAETHSWSQFWLLLSPCMYSKPRVTSMAFNNLADTVKSIDKNISDKLHDHISKLEKKN